MMMSIPNNSMIQTPTLIVDKQKCIQNIQTMVQKAKEAQVRLRPHCKTHACLEIAHWMRHHSNGYIDSITVSSLSMAEYFAQHDPNHNNSNNSNNNNNNQGIDGWTDILVAFPINILEIDRIQQIWNQPNMQLTILVENVEAVEYLQEHLKMPLQNENKLGVFIKIDVGYGRTGIPAHHLDTIDAVIECICQYKETFDFGGFLTHAGHAYHCRSQEQVYDIHQITKQLFQTLKQRYIERFPKLQLSMGDTPTCSILPASEFVMFDEIRPGNFIFYDLEQAMIGSCHCHQISVVVACPIVAKHDYEYHENDNDNNGGGGRQRRRRELILYGGGVHFSKDRIIIQTTNGDNNDNNNNNESTTTTTTTTTTIFGRVVRRKSSSSSTTTTTTTSLLEWENDVIEGMYVRSLSQEHGVVVVPNDHDMNQYHIGDVLFVLPVHSCMTADCLKYKGYLTTDGQVLERMKN